MSADEADLVVLGSGAAALTGAAVAALGGASVIVLEKADVVGGTSAVSGGGLWIPLNRHMAERGVEDSREEALAYMRACAGDQGDDAHIVALVDHGAAMVELLEDQAGLAFQPWPAEGGTLDYRPWLPGSKPGARTLDARRFRLADLGEWAERLRHSRQAGYWAEKFDYFTTRGHVRPPAPPAPAPDGPQELFQSGVALMGRLLRACVEAGVEIRTGTPAHELLLEDGRVVAVRAGDDARIAARRGVLVATGGYGASEELKRLWLQRPLEATCEVESNTGDGHLMGLAAGAAVAGLGDAWWGPHMAAGRNPDGSLALAFSREDRSVPHTLMVNRRGRRFMNESTNYYDACAPFGLKQGAELPNHPAWWICDAQARERYAVIAAKFPGGEAPDWMVAADSLDALAQRLGVDARALGETVERFNAFAREGVDRDFGRGEDAWDVAWGDPLQRPNPSLGTVERPPFFALEVRSGALATRGGLGVDGGARVLSALRPFAPIPGLYAAGNASSGGVGGAYVGAGATIGAAMTFGYIAGRRIAAGADLPEPDRQLAQPA